MLYVYFRHEGTVRTGNGLTGFLAGTGVSIPGREMEVCPRILSDGIRPWQRKKNGAVVLEQEQRTDQKR